MDDIFGSNDIFGFSTLPPQSKDSFNLALAGLGMMGRRPGTSPFSGLAAGLLIPNQNQDQQKKSSFDFNDPATLFRLAGMVSSNPQQQQAPVVPQVGIHNPWMLATGVTPDTFRYR